MQRPIGWWLKHLDRLIDQQFDAAFRGAGLDRRRWQILNLIAEGPSTEPQLAVALQPFWEDAAEELPTALAALEEDRCIAEEPGRRWTMTDAGRSVLDEARTQVEAIRARLSDGLSREDYDRTVDVLTRMAANMDPSLDAA